MKLRDCSKTLPARPFPSSFTLRAAYPFRCILAARLFGEGPVGFKFGQNSDEYEPEVGSILPRLASCRGLEDIQRIPGDGAAAVLPLWERASICMG
jgi:hypothetical protein